MKLSAAGRLRLSISAQESTAAALARVAARAATGEPLTVVVGRWGAPLAESVGIMRLAAASGKSGWDLVLESPDREVVELARREGINARIDQSRPSGLIAPIRRTLMLMNLAGVPDGRRSLGLWLGGPLLLTGILLGTLALWLLVLYPSAQVDIVPTRWVQQVHLTAYANPSFADVSPRQRLLPGRVISGTASGRISRSGTGARVIESSRASGAVLLTNLTSAILTVPQGTVLVTADGRRFLTAAALALPPQAQLQDLVLPTADPISPPQDDPTPEDDPTPPQDDPTPEDDQAESAQALAEALDGIEILENYPYGASDLPPVVAIRSVGGMRVTIEAEIAGADSNLASGAVATAAGSFGGLIEVSQPEPLTGGADTSSAFVTENDRLTALDELTARLRTQAQDQLRAQLTGGEYAQVLPGSQLRPEFTSVYSSQLGDDGVVTFTYGVELSINATAFDRADLERLAVASLEDWSDGPAQYRLLPGSLTVSEPNLSATLGNTVTISYQAQGELENLIEPDLIRRQIAGQPTSVAAAFVDSLPGVADSQLRIWSPFGDSITLLPARIAVNVVGLA